MNKLIVFPLVLLIFLGCLNTLGLHNDMTGDGVQYGGIFAFGAGGNGWWDESGHKVCDVNFTAVGEDGVAVRATDGGYAWINNTGTVEWIRDGAMAYDDGLYTSSVGNWWAMGQYYTIFNNSSGANTAFFLQGFSIYSSLGILAIVILIIGVALVVGLHFLGSGESETGVMTIIKGGSYLGLWGCFSVVAGGLIGSIPILGALFWLFLTLVYTLGVVSSIGHSEGA